MISCFSRTHVQVMFKIRTKLKLVFKSLMVGANSQNQMKDNKNWTRVNKIKY